MCGEHENGLDAPARSTRRSSRSMAHGSRCWMRTPGTIAACSIACRAVFALLFSMLAMPSCTPERARAVQAAGYSQAPQLLPAQMQADFDLMSKALEEAHAGLYRYVSRPEIDRAFAAQRAKLDHPMSKIEFLAVLMETTAAIRCGHTGVQ